MTRKSAVAFHHQPAASDVAVAHEPHAKQKLGSKKSPDKTFASPFTICVALAILGVVSRMHYETISSTTTIMPLSSSRKAQSILVPLIMTTWKGSNTYVNQWNEAKLPFRKQRYDVCVVGAGLSGAVIAERYANLLDQSVLVVEKRDHIGGNCYDFMDPDAGVRVSKYGAHLFHTTYDKVWNYIQQFSEWTPYEHKVIGLVNGMHVPIPVNIHTVNRLFGVNITNEREMTAWLQSEQVHYDHEPRNAEQVALSRVGPRLYRLLFQPYTEKQWGRPPSELGPEVTARIPVRNNYDDRYFGDPYQALPKHGYTAVFEQMLRNNNDNIEVHTSTDYFQIRHSVDCGRTYYTGPIDAYFAHLGWETLQYRSLRFERHVVLHTKNFFQPAFVVNHPYPEAKFTRIVEYKHLPNQPPSNHTVYFIEYSSETGEPYYPVPNKRNKDLYAKYQSMAEKEPNVTFVGRLANYKYFNMDDAILNALNLFEQDTKGL